MIKNIGISKKEWLFILALSGIILLIASVAYIFAYFETPAGLVYTGTRFNAFYDFSSYFAWIMQAKEGHVLFRDLFTSELQTGALFHPYFFLLGKLAWLLNITSLTAFHIGRIVGGLIFLISSYLTVAFFVKSVKWRVITFLMIVFSSGLGWVLPSHRTGDFIYSETSVFLSLIETVLIPISITVLLASFITYITRAQRSVTKTILLLGLLGNILTLLHGYDVVVMISVLFGFAVWDTYREKNSIAIRIWLYFLLLCFPSLVWQAYALSMNPGFATWGAVQTNVSALIPVTFMFSYGLLLVLGLMGVLVVLKEQMQKYYYLLIWIFVTLALVYNPLSSRFQQKFSIGLPIALVLLSSLAIRWLYARYQHLSYRRITIKPFLIALIGLTFLTNVSIFLQDINNKYLDVKVFMTQDQSDAIDWIGRNIHDSDVVLAGRYMGNLIPGYTGKTVFLGHYDITIAYRQKVETVKNVLSSKIVNRDPLSTFVTLNAINYIVADKEISDFSPNTLSQLAGRTYLQPVYKNTEVVIYKVNIE